MYAFDCTLVMYFGNCCNKIHLRETLGFYTTIHHIRLYESFDVVCVFHSFHTTPHEMFQHCFHGINNTAFVVKFAEIGFLSTCK